MYFKLICGNLYSSGHISRIALVKILSAVLFLLKHFLFHTMVAYWIISVALWCPYLLLDYTAESFFFLEFSHGKCSDFVNRIHKFYSMAHSFSLKQGHVFSDELIIPLVFVFVFSYIFTVVWFHMANLDSYNHNLICPTEMFIFIGEASVCLG